MATAEEIISTLGLTPHPNEGGYFVESYRSEATIPWEALPGRYPGPRSASTAIYYLLTPETFSEMHRLRSDEVFHFYLGDPVEMLQLGPDGSGKTVVMGQDIAVGMKLQVVVPAGSWQGTKLLSGGSFALLGCTVAPGFDYADYESGSRSELIAAYPRFEEQITALTRWPGAR